MNLYLLKQTEHNGWDTYLECVVVAEDAESACLIHPAEYESQTAAWARTIGPQWATHPNKVTAILIGVAHSSLKAGTVVTRSYRQG